MEHPIIQSVVHSVINYPTRTGLWSLIVLAGTAWLEVCDIPPIIIHGTQFIGALLVIYVQIAIIKNIKRKNERKR